MQNKLLTYLKLHRDVFILAAGQALALAINIYLNIILGKKYSAEAYGNLGIFIAIALFMGDIVNLKSDMAIMLEHSREKSISLFLQSIGIGVIVSLSFALILTLVNVFYTIPVLYIYMYCLFMAFLQPCMIWLNKSGNNKALSMIRWLQVLLTGLVPLIVIKWQSENGLIWGMIIAVGCSSLVAFLYSDIQVKEIKLVSWQRMFGNAILLRQFVTYGTLSSLCNTISRSVPYFFIDRYFGKIYLGQFTFANKLLNAPLSVFTTAMSQYYYREGSKMNNHLLYKFNIQSVIFLFSIITLPSFVIFYCGEDILNLIFGSQWALAGQILKFLMWWQLFAFVANPLTMYFDIKRILDKELIINIAVLILRIAVTYLCVEYFDFFTSVAVFGIVSGFINLFLITYIYFHTKKSLIAN